MIIDPTRALIHNNPLIRCCTSHATVRTTLSTISTTTTTTTRRSILANALPPALALISSSTQLAASITDAATDHDNYDDNGDGERWSQPRVRSVAYMACALVLHFGGYEFMRNSCLALFTSRDFGFHSASAFPLANGMISLFSVIMLWAYGRTLENDGPRGALRNSTLACILFIVGTVASLALSTCTTQLHSVGKGIVGLAFLFQNTYQHLLYMQHWSFMSSVVDPDEGSRWFPTLSGCSSLFASFLGSLIPFIVPRTGLLGLMLITTLFLSGSLFFGDRAYFLAEKYGFDPHKTQQLEKEQSQQQEQHSSSPEKPSNHLTTCISLFRRVPTLRALMGEVISYQSLSTILNVAFVQALKEGITDDIARSSYTGQYYAMINAISTAIQFTLLPFVLKRFEQSTLWRTMPIWPLIACVILVLTTGHLPLYLLASAFFVAKLMDYAFRSVGYITVYQPLDFESRYLGKETVGLFGGRFGKSATSLILSGLTAAGMASVRQLCRLALAFNGLWMGATWWLANTIPSRAEAQAIVEERTRALKEDKDYDKTN